MSTENPTYEIEAVPPVGDQRSSRFALGSLPAGWQSTSRAATVAHVFAELVQKRKREAEPNRPGPKTVNLRFPVRLEEGTWTTVHRGAVTRIPTFEPCRPGKFRKAKLEAGALLDDVLLRGKSFETARDGELWTALAELCHDLDNPHPREVRQLADWIAVLVCRRAGIDVTTDELPYPAHLKAAA